MDIKNTCFVCKTPVTAEKDELNLVVNMKVCRRCKGSEREKQTEKNYLKSLAEGFVCGCI